MSVDLLTERIIGAAIEVHRHLGPGLLESVYEDALCYEFELQGIAYARQALVRTRYKDRELSPQRVDLLVENEVILELKSVAKTSDAHVAQVLSYLRATGLHKGLLLNFGENRLVDGIKRVSL